MKSLRRRTDGRTTDGRTDDGRTTRRTTDGWTTEVMAKAHPGLWPGELSILTSDGGADTTDLKARLDKARGAFLKLRNIWKSSNISKKTKIKLYNSCVISVLLYDAGCWRITEIDVNKLSSFHNGCLRKISRHIVWQRKITNVELHENNWVRRYGNNTEKEKVEMDWPCT